MGVLPPRGGRQHCLNPGYVRLVLEAVRRALAGSETRHGEAAGPFAGPWAAGGALSQIAPTCAKRAEAADLLHATSSCPGCQRASSAKSHILAAIDLVTVGLGADRRRGRRHNGANAIVTG